MELKIIVPIIVAFLTALAGMVTYLLQKKTDRRNDLIKLRQLKYQRYLDAFQNTVNVNTVESLGEYHKAILSLFVVASDAVIIAVGNLNAYMADTSPGSNLARNMHRVGELLSDALKAMREDCFEKSNLDTAQVRNLLPIQGVQDRDRRQMMGNEVYRNSSDNENKSKAIQPRNKSEITEMSERDSGLKEIDKHLEEAKRGILHNYQELIRIGNPSGANTAQIAVIAYMAESLSTLSLSQLDHLRKQGVLRF